ncbi:MAG: TolC family protein [Vulcanimicrobiota bacterium]
MKATVNSLLLLMVILITVSPGAFSQEKKYYTIEECARIGIDNSFKLKTYDSKVVQNSAKVRETLAVNNPSVSISGSSTYQRPEISFGLPVALPGMAPIQAIIVPEWYHNYNIAVTKLITSFGKVEAAARVTQVGDLQYKTQQRIDQDSLLFDIVRGYYNVILAEQLVEIAAAQEKLWEEQYKVSESMYKRGTVAKYDLLRVHVSLTQSRDQHITNLKDLEVARGNLRTLMGLPVGTLIEDIDDHSLWADREKEKMELPLEHWRVKARQNSPAIQLGKAARLQGVYALDLAVLDNAPSLSFQSNYNRLTQTFASKDWEWQNTFALSIPLSDGGQRSAKITQAKELITQADLNIQDTERTVLWNVEKSYLDLHDLQIKIKTAEEQLDAAKEGSRVANIRYKAGLGTIVELTDAELSLVKAKVNLTQTYCSYHIQMAALSYTSGILYDDIFMSGRNGE